MEARSTAAPAGAAGQRLILPLILASAVCVALRASQALAQTPIPPTAPDFAMSAAQCDQYEIVAARDALAQSHDPRIQAFAQQMITDHMKTSDAVRQAAVASGAPPPPQAMSTDGASMVSALQSLRGADFDKAYIRQQILAHHQALAVERSYAEAGDNPGLRRAAQQAVPVIQHHLQMAEQISRTFAEP